MMQLITNPTKLKIESYPTKNSATVSPKTENQAKATDCATKPSLRIKDPHWLNLYKAIDLAG